MAKTISNKARKQLQAIGVPARKVARARRRELDGHARVTKKSK